MRRRNAKPPRRPTVAGPMEPISMEGISSDHTDAATITPDANPSRAFCNKAGISFFMKNTNPDPRAVPRNGIISAASTGFISFTVLLVQR